MTNTSRNATGEPEKFLAAAARSADARPAIERLKTRAHSEGLVEIVYATMDSPFGELMVARTDRGLVRTSLPNYEHGSALDELAWSVSPRIIESKARLDDVRRELDRYFEGKLREFKVPLDWRLIDGFQTGVLQATAAIPYGQTRSYGEVAAEAGNPRAYRAAGTALGKNPLAPLIPCHRVLQAGGKVGNYGGGPEMKRKLLTMEGALSDEG